MKRGYIVTNIDQIKEICCEDEVVIGHEGCVYRALSSMNRDCVLAATLRGNDVRFVTPLVPERYVEDLRRKIDDLSRFRVLKVVFNDYGLLYACSDLISKGRIIPVLGRIITRSIIDCPWHDRILSSENDDIRDAVYGNSFVHKAKLDILDQYQIKEIETNWYSSEYIDELARQGLKITVYGENSLISTSRVCYEAYWRGVAIQSDCVGYCNNKRYIHLAKKWSKKWKTYMEPNDEDGLLYEKLYVRGNQVFLDINMEEKDICNIPYCVVTEMGVGEDEGQCNNLYL